MRRIRRLGGHKRAFAPVSINIEITDKIYAQDVYCWSDAAVTQICKINVHTNGVNMGQAQPNYQQIGLRSIVSFLQGGDD